MTGVERGAITVGDGNDDDDNGEGTTLYGHDAADPLVVGNAVKRMAEMMSDLAIVVDAITVGDLAIVKDANSFFALFP